MKMHKRHLSTVVLFLMICLLAFPVSAMAASKSTPAAKIGNKSYATLQAALKAVGKNQTIKLMKDVTVNGYLKANRNVTFTLDLNKKTLKTGYDAVNEDSGHLFINKGNVTIKNGTVDTTVQVNKNASLKIQNCTMDTLVSYGALIIKSGSFHDLMINDGTTKILDGKVSWIEQDKGTLTIWKVTAEYLHIFGGTALVKGGTFSHESVYPTVRVTDDGVLKITGGTFTNAKGSVIAVFADMSDKVSAKLTISGGKIRCISKSAAAVSIAAKQKEAASRISIKSSCVTAVSKKKIKYDPGYTMN